MSNYYEILEVSEKASKEVIEKAYKALAKKYHPDLNPDNKKEAEQKIKEINEAYEVLIDEHRRSNYDSILHKKRELKKRKEAYSNNTSNSNEKVERNFEDYNKISYSNGYYTDNDDNFYINTNNMDEKTKKKLQQKIQERYLEAYDSYLRERGYKLKYRWTFKRILTLILAIFLVIALLTILFFIPPIHNWCLELYEENIVVRLIGNFIKAIINTII